MSQYIQSNIIINDNIRQYLQKARRQSFCNCLDGCQNSRKCACYKWNRKLQNPTYNKTMSPRSGQMVAYQLRAKTSINKVFSFNECHPKCACNKDLCQNYLVAAQNKRRWRLLVKRLEKHLSPIYSQEMLNTKKNSNLPPSMLAPSPQNGRNSSSGPSSVVSQRPAQICMWGLVAMEDIPAGAFLMEY